MQYYDGYAICHVKLEDPAFLPDTAWPSFEELEDRRLLLRGAHDRPRRVQQGCLVTLARTYRLTLPLVMAHLPPKRQQAVFAALKAP